MGTRPRLFTAVTALAAVLLVAGCASTPGADSPTSSGAPRDSTEAPASGSDDIEAALLDDGRMFAVVTWGSSTCVPRVDGVTAEGQTVAVALVDAEDSAEQVCTADLAPRASIGALPEGVDPTTEITLRVTYGDTSEDVDVDGGAFSGVPGTSTEYQPSAGWYDDGGLVLLTWGSSSCAPIVESVEVEGDDATVTFETDAEQICTMDMAPRATLVHLGDDVDDDADAFTLTLVGGGLDGTVEVR